MGADKSEPESGIFQILKSIVPRKPPEDFGEPQIAGATSVPFSKGNFHPIRENDASLCFVDGGNNTIYLSPVRAIQMVRLYGSWFDSNGRRAGKKKYTYIVDVDYDADSENYIARIYDVDNSGLYNDRMKIAPGTLRDRAISEVGGYIRRLGEWLMMERLATEGVCDFIIHDGTLQTGAPDEYSYQNRVFNKTNGIAGLSKTCTLRTSRGFALVAAVNYISKRYGVRAPWYYYPVAKNIPGIKGDMYIVKFRESSEYAFRTEIYPEHLAEEILGALLAHSDDATFIGYPYGLLDADIKARIRDEEAKMYRSMIYEMAENYTVMEMRAVDAHDRISEVR
jgi:hypothetical protein